MPWARLRPWARAERIRSGDLTTRVRRLAGRAGDPASSPRWTATRKGAGDMTPTRPRRVPVVPSRSTCMRLTLGYGADQRPRVARARVRGAARLRGPVSVCARRVDLAQRAGAQAAVGVDEALPPRTSRPRALQVEAAGAEDDAVALDVGDHVARVAPARVPAACAGTALRPNAVAVLASTATRVRRIGLMSAPALAHEVGPLPDPRPSSRWRCVLTPGGSPRGRGSASRDDAGS